MKYIKEYGWCFWLGLSIPIFTKINVFDWQFYAIIIPMVFLVILFKNKEELKEDLEKLENDNTTS